MHYIKISSFRFYHTKSDLYLCLYIYGYKSLLFVGFFYKYQAPSLGQVLCEAPRIHLLTITHSYQVSVSGNFEPTGARWLRSNELVRLEVRVMTEKSRKAGLIPRVREGFPAKGRAELDEAWRGRSHPWRPGGGTEGCRQAGPVQRWPSRWCTFCAHVSVNTVVFAAVSGFRPLYRILMVFGRSSVDFLGCLGL